MALLLALVLQDHVDTDHGFRFRVPDGWELRKETAPSGAIHVISVVRKEERVTVYVLENPAAMTEDQALQALEKSLKGGQEKGTLGKKELPAIRFTHEGTSILRFCLVRGDRIYLIDAIGDGREVRDSFELIERRKGEIDFVHSWEAAAKRGKPVLVVIEHYGGLTVGPKMYLFTTFLDADFVELLRERFSVAELRPEQIPNRGYFHGGYFGVSFLFYTPEGKLLRDESTRNPVALYAVACDVLAKIGGPTGQDAETCLRRGELAKAEELLRDSKDLRMKSILLRRQLRYEEALAVLRKAGNASPMDEARLLLDLQRYDEAKKILEGLRTPEARYRLAEARVRTGDREGSKPIFEEVAKGNDRWAGAAAMILENWHLVGGGPRRWDAQDVRMLVDRPARENVDADRARRDAVEWLLKNRRKNGAWLAPHDIDGHDPTFPLACDAIAARSLLPYRDRADVRKAVEDALARILATHRQVLYAGDKPTLVTYEVWAEAFVLRFLADCLRLKIGDEAKVRAAAETLVEDLRKRQRPVGGWTYFLRADASKPSEPADVGISFVTAAVLHGLVEIRAAGVRVPDAMIEKGGACLAAMRRKTGFTYMTGAGRETTAEAAGRGPACMRALTIVKRDADVRAALDYFVANREIILGEMGKSGMHAGPNGQGCHYVWYDYLFAAEAAAELGDAKIKEILIADVLGTRLADGGFAADSPGSGRTYATAVALYALTRLR